MLSSWIKKAEWEAKTVYQREEEKMVGTTYISVQTYRIGTGASVEIEWALISTVGPGAGLQVVCVQEGKGESEGGRKGGKKRTNVIGDRVIKGRCGACTDSRTRTIGSIPVAERGSKAGQAHEGSQGSHGDLWKVW